MSGWVRLWHDMATDSKWRTISRKSGQPLSAVIAVFILILTNASANAAKRGTLFAWSDEDAAAALDLNTEQVTSIMSAMQGKVLNGAVLSGWNKRQPKREDAGIGARVARYREAKMKRTETQCNAPDVDIDIDVNKEPIQKESTVVYIEGLRT